MFLFNRFLLTFAMPFYAAQYDQNSDDAAAVLQLVEVPKPESVASDEVLIQVKAAAINPVDGMVITGATEGFGWSKEFPFTMGYDFSGTVALVGDGVNDGWKTGDDVFGVNWGTASHDSEPAAGGAFANYIVMKASKVSKKDPSVSYEEAAAVALVGTTAYQALGQAGVHSGDTKKILILGGSSAVGSMAIQIAKAAGCWVATTCSPRTKEYVEGFGSDLVIDYTKDKWEEVEAIKGIDAIFDTVGDAEGLERGKTVLRPDGYFVTIVGHHYGFDPSAHPPLKFASSFILSNSAADQDTLMSMMAAGKLKCVVEKTFPFTQEGVLAMLERQKSGKNMGKSVLTMM